MDADDRDIASGSDLDLAIERALEAANLRAGDSLPSATAVVGVPEDPSAAEAGDGADDGD